MHKTYICSRFRAYTPEERQFNIDVARYFCKVVIDRSPSEIPIAPHLFFPQFMDDDNEDERECGIEMGLELLTECDTIVVVIIDNHVSEGMMGEISLCMQRAVEMDVEIIRLTRKEAEELIRKVA